jgi:hypothetical protein
MRYRLLAVFPLAWGALFLAGVALWSGTPSYAAFLRVETEAAKLLALAGAWAAAAAFRPGEYPRRAWFLIGLCMALLLARDLTLLPLGFEALGERNLAWLRGLLVAAGNLSQVVGVWLLARAWRVADLSLPGSSRAQTGVVLAAALLAGVFAGPSVVTNAARAAAGDLTALTAVASALGDTVSLCLIAPLLLTALALRGGLIGWPWSLLTVSYVCWLLYDGALVYGPAAGLEPASVRVLGELFRALGCAFGFSAGMAQRGVVVDLLRLGRDARSAT